MSGQRVEHTGQGGEFFAIFIVNFLLTVLTLGIYRFWAKSRNRRYLWSHTSFDGEQFEYDGEGMELFMGFLKAIGILIVAGLVVFGLSAVLGMVSPILTFFPVIAFYLFLVLVAPFAARYGAQKYLLARSRLRGVRFAMSGSAIRFGWYALGQAVLTIVTLGLYAPFASMKLERYASNNMLYGSLPFSFDGAGRDLFGSFFIAWLLTIPTLGLVWIWYSTVSAKYQAQHTCLGDLQFDTSFTTGQLFGLILTNLLLLVFTLGLALPWIAVRTLRFNVTHLRIDGELNYASIAQSVTRDNATGEGFAEALDAGLGI